MSQYPFQVFEIAQHLVFDQECCVIARGPVALFHNVQKGQNIFFRFHNVFRHLLSGKARGHHGNVVTAVKDLDYHGEPAAADAPVILLLPAGIQHFRFC